MKQQNRRDYDPLEAEPRWQKRWLEDSTYAFDVQSTPRTEKFYNLVEFPYPSAEGLHVGHVLTYCGADTLGRYQRMRGKRVFQPMGFDAFGINAENYALKTDEHPKPLMEHTIAAYTKLLKRVGAAWDWDHTVTTCDPSYYRWTQWVFLQLYKAGLAYRTEAPVIWCPSCLTVLANEQVEGDRCERCESRVTTRVMKQWFLRITKYADALIDGLDSLDWPSFAKKLQRDWIGRSAGVEIDFRVGESSLVLQCFTTRSDTLFGLTFLAVAPDFPEREALASVGGRGSEVSTFVETVRGRRASPWDRQPAEGVPTGAFAIHPITGGKLPIFVADYVVGDYGSGAVMGVPAHDHRDFEFARAMNIPSVQVIKGPNPEPERAYVGEGLLIKSGTFDGLDSKVAREEITSRLEGGGVGRRVTRYRLHDWLISRQRYWGPPIPIVYCESCGEVPVPEEQLPVVLPEVEDFRPTGSGLSPLASEPDFVHTTCPNCHGPATRETDVSDTFFDSSWYFLRYTSTDIEAVPWDSERTQRLLPVDHYAGGPEHIARHHLYARFVTMALHDLGHLPFAEPFPKIRIHGMLIKDGAKMSKSRGNVVIPDDYIEAVGSDNLRCYLLFCGPWEQGGDFSDRGLGGVVRFTNRVWTLVSDEPPTGEGGVDMAMVARSIARVERDIERLKFNTAIAALMEFTNWAAENRSQMSAEEWHGVAKNMILLLAPFMPHLAEEMWEEIGEEFSVHLAKWPEYNASALQEEEVTIIVQVDGKMRDQLTVSPEADEPEITSAALDSEKVKRWIRDRAIRRVVFVSGRLVNIVTD